MKKVTLELGGKNALIGYPDADPAEVASAAVRGMNFTWCGQSCGRLRGLSCTKAFMTRSSSVSLPPVGKIKPGLPTDEATEMGCLVSKRNTTRS